MDEFLPFFFFCMRLNLAVAGCSFESIAHSKQCQMQLHVVLCALLRMSLFAAMQHLSSHAYSSCELLLSLYP